MFAALKHLFVAAATAVDLYWSRTVLLLKSLGASGVATNASVIDSAPYPLGSQRAGDATQGAVTPYIPSGYWSGYFPNTGLAASHYLSIPDNTALQMGTGDFTVEFWHYPTNFAMYNEQGFFNKGHYNTTGCLWIGQFSGAVYVYANGTYLVGSGTPILVENRWNHVAVVRSGGTLYIYVNGVLASSAASTHNFNSTATAYISGSPNTNYPFAGYMSNFRIVKGTAVYTSAFTPPTAPLTAIPGTSLLTLQDNRFKDNSPNGFVVTKTGDAVPSRYSPFPYSPGASGPLKSPTSWSAYFGNTSSYGGNSLAIADNAALNMGTGDFTIEFWVNFQSFQAFSEMAMFVKGEYGATGCIWIASGWFSNSIELYLNGAGVGSTSNKLIEGAWNHVAVVRSSSVLKIYINGVSGFSITSTHDLTNTAPVWIAKGRSDGAYTINGWMSNLRVVKGTAVYTSNFVPPTAPLTAIPGTSLLALQDASFKDNSANNFAITVVGNPGMTPANPFDAPPYPAGYWSGYFDGNGYITLPNNAAFGFGSGDFTMECWFFKTGNNLDPLIDTRNGAGGNGLGLAMYVQANVLKVGNSAELLAGGTIVNNTWNHCAVTRSGNTLSLYLNGTRVAVTAVFATAQALASTPYIGYSVANEQAIGYISNVRIVKGTAVYTGGSYTVPTAPLTAISGTSILTFQDASLRDNSGNNFAVTRTSAHYTVAGGNVRPFSPFFTSFDPGRSIALDTMSEIVWPGSGTSTAFAMGTGDFTMEFWYRLNKSATGASWFFTKNVGGNGNDFLTQLYQNTWYFYYGSNQAVSYINNAVGGFTVGVWHHLAVVRANGVITLYINGKAAGVNSTVGTAMVNTGFSVGYSSVGPDGANMSNLRVVKGTAVYTSNFTPPTGPLTAIPGTSLLALQPSSNIINDQYRDWSSNAHTFSVTAPAYVSLDSPFNSTDASVISLGGSAYFDGTGDWIVTTSDTLVAGTGNFTFECWINIAAPNNHPIFESRSGQTTDGFTLTAYTSTTIRIWCGSAIITSGTLNYAGQWTHVAVTRSSGTWTLWVNGVSQGTSTASADMTNPVAVIGGGRYSGASIDTSFQGYIADARFVRGRAVYGGGFTPPSLPLKAIPGTSLLMQFDNAAVLDATRNQDVFLVGNAALSKTQTKYATSSIYFPGEQASYVGVNNKDIFNFGNGDFTIEFWSYINAFASGGYTVFFRSDSSGNYVDAGCSISTLQFNTRAASILSVTATLSPGTWNHIAYCRSNNVLRAFVNGVLAGSATDNTVYANGDYVRIGGSSFSSGHYYQGYMEDFRVTKTARYTENFTPPSKLAIAAPSS